MPNTEAVRRLVMLVEDDGPARRVLERWLTQEGCTVASFESFEAARGYLSDHRPDAIVADIRLGAYNGLQLVRLAQAGRPDITAVVISGFDDPVLRREAEGAGARYLVKPLRREQLLAALAKVG